MKTLRGIVIGLQIGLCIIAALFIGYCFAIACLNQDRFTLADFSNVGNVLAGAGAIVGLVLLYLTYKSQKKELEVTQKTLRLQKIDTAFFNMLSLLQELVKAMSHVFTKSSGGEETLEGRAYLKKALEQLHTAYMLKARINMRPNPDTGQFNSFNPSLSYITGEDEDKNPETVNYQISISYNELIVEVSKMFEEFYNEHQQNLGHYFRYIYNIVKYVLDSVNRLDEEDKQRYLSILQSQLSNDEMGLIFYNVLSKHGQTTSGEYRFLKWLDKYGLLENMDSQSLKCQWHHWFFPNTFFKFLDPKERERKIKYIANLAKFNIPYKNAQ